MAKVVITPSLLSKVYKLLKQDSPTVLGLMRSLEDNPKKGKAVGAVGNILIKELKYKTSRFYCISDKHKITFLDTDQLGDLLIKFVEMSAKKDQQKVIEQIKSILKNMGNQGFA